MSHRPRLTVIAALAAALVPATALADSNGGVGQVEGLAVYERSSDNYAMASGVLTVKEKSGAKRDYKWGGSLCPGRELGATNIALLFEAFRERGKIHLAPTYKLGNGNTRCLTGFKFQK